MSLSTYFIDTGMDTSIPLSSTALASVASPGVAITSDVTKVRTIGMALLIVDEDATGHLTIESATIGVQLLDTDGNVIGLLTLGSMTAPQAIDTVLGETIIQITAETTVYTDGFQNNVALGSVVLIGDASVKNADGAGAHVVTLGVIGMVEIS